MNKYTFIGYLLILTVSLFFYNKLKIGSKSMYRSMIITNRNTYLTACFKANQQTNKSYEVIIKECYNGERSYMTTVFGQDYLDIYPQY